MTRIEIHNFKRNCDPRVKEQFRMVLVKQGRTDPKCLLGARICGKTRESQFILQTGGGAWTPILTPLNLFVFNEIYMVGSSI